MSRAAPDSCWTHNSLLGCFPLQTASSFFFFLSLFHSLGFARGCLLLTASCRHTLRIQGCFSPWIDWESQGAGLSSRSPAFCFAWFPHAFSLGHAHLSLSTLSLPPAPGCLSLSAGLAFPYTAKFPFLLPCRIS